MKGDSRKSDDVTGTLTQYNTICVHYFGGNHQIELEIVVGTASSSMSTLCTHLLTFCLVVPALCLYALLVVPGPRLNWSRSIVYRFLCLSIFIFRWVQGDIAKQLSFLLLPPAVWVYASFQMLSVNMDRFAKASFK